MLGGIEALGEEFAGGFSGDGGGERDGRQWRGRDFGGEFVVESDDGHVARDGHAQRAHCLDEVERGDVVVGDDSGGASFLEDELGVGHRGVVHAFVAVDWFESTVFEDGLVCVSAQVDGGVSDPSWVESFVFDVGVGDFGVSKLEQVVDCLVHAVVFVEVDSVATWACQPVDGDIGHGLFFEL